MKFTKVKSILIRLAEASAQDKRKAIFLIFVCAIFSITACTESISENSGALNSMQEYRWDVSESAPNEYVMQIISGYLEAADGYKKDIPSRVVLNNGWGKGRSNIASGRENMPLPKRMEVTWFDYRADTFYHGAFDLPFDELQKSFSILEKRPYAEDFDENPGGRFIVGLAPEGLVVVWLSVRNHYRVVFTGEAKAIEGIPWSAVFENPEFTKEEIMEETIQEVFDDFSDSPRLNDPNYWKRLHSELYHYNVKVESDYTPYSIGAAFLNSTSHTYYSDAQNWLEEPNSVIKNISFGFFFPNRIPVVAIDNINSEEMYSAFRKLAKISDDSLEMVIKIEGSLLEGWEYTPRIFVRNEEESIEIKGFEFTPISNADSLEEVKASKNLMRYMNYPDKPATP